MSIEPFIEQLYARLPEIEWQFNQLDSSVLTMQIPAGLFQCKPLTTHACMDEIKANLDALKKQNTEQAIRYLCLVIEKKINTVVRICKGSSTRKVVEAIRTRQQCLKDLQAEVAVLTRQQQALLKNTQVSLQLEKELGEVTRRLIQAQQRLRALSDNVT